MKQHLHVLLASTMYSSAFRPSITSCQVQCISCDVATAGLGFTAAAWLSCTFRWACTCIQTLTVVLLTACFVAFCYATGSFARSCQHTRHHVPSAYHCGVLYKAADCPLPPAPTSTSCRFYYRCCWLSRPPTRTSRTMVLSNGSSL